MDESDRLLLIDDDRELCASLGRLLQLDGFVVHAVHTGEEGVRSAVGGRFALVVLDVMLPGMDGRAVLHSIRSTSDVPVIMLTARGSETDRIRGLQAGADDYLPKPFSVRELSVRIRAVLKRHRAVPADVGELRWDDLVVRPRSRSVSCAGEAIALTGTEYEILLCLLEHAGSAVSRETIAKTCLGRPVGVMDRSIDNHVSNLRKKLGAYPDGAERIRNLRGTGYSYCLQQVAT